MKEDYIVDIVTTQNMDGEISELKMTTLADFNGSENDYYISYTDNYGDMKDCRTTLHVENGNCVTVNRDGNFDAHIVIEKHSRHISHHLTPYGSLSFGVSALDVESSIKNGGGRLHFKYETDIDMRPVSTVEFDIWLRNR